ncbi:hypothetical protein CHS0354_001150 [Potamilus streckersoni]|uniref:Chitin-binding type-2 domain-containing protein n=1 Tax=Potamilus streckersoni TaxID=2493646 RepID=A0AAE0RM64_9BIVA|nr:hypothetical protein CHS0354_001150 [Potamilus streckersoni]
MAIDFTSAGVSSGGDGFNFGSAASVGAGSGGVGLNMGLDIVGGGKGIGGLPRESVGNNGGGDGVGLDVVSSNIGGGSGGTTGAKSDAGKGFNGASIGGGGVGGSAQFRGLDGVSGDISFDSSNFGGGSAGLSGGLGISVEKSGTGGTGVGYGSKAGNAGGDIGNMALGIVHDGQQAEREIVEISGGGTPGKKVVYVKERDNEDNDKKYYVTTTIRPTRGGGGGGGSREGRGGAREGGRGGGGGGEGGRGGGVGGGGGGREGGGAGGGGGGKGASDGTLGGGASFGGVISIGVGAGGLGSGSISGGNDITAMDMILSGGTVGEAGSALVSGIGGNVERISGSAGIGQSVQGGDAQGIDIGRPSVKIDVGGPSPRNNVGGPSLGIDLGGPSFDSIKLGFDGGNADAAVNVGVVGGSGTISDVRNIGGGINGGVDAVKGVLGSGCASGFAPGCGGMILDIGGASGRGDGGGIGVGNLGSSGSGGATGREGLGNAGIGSGIGDTHSFGGARSGFNILESGRSGGGVDATSGFKIDIGMRRNGGASSFGGDIGGFSKDGREVIHGGGNGGIGGGIDFTVGRGDMAFGGIRTKEGLGGGGVEAKYVPMGNDGVVFANGVGNLGSSGSGGATGREGLGNAGIGSGIGDTHNVGGARSGFNILESGGSGGGVGATSGFEIDIGMRRNGGASSFGGDIGGFSKDGREVIHGGGNGGIGGGIDLTVGRGDMAFGGIRTNKGLGGGVEAKYVPMGNDGVVFANVPQANIQGSIASGGPISISIPDIVIDPGQLQRMEEGSLNRTFPVPLGSGSDKSQVKVMVVVSVPLRDSGAFGGDGSIGASENLGKVDFSFDQRSGSITFDGSKIFDFNMTTTTLSPLKIDIDKSKDDEKLKTKIKLQRGNGDLAKKAEIKVKQKLEDDEKIKIKIETKVPGLDGRKETEMKFEGEAGMNIKVPGMDVGLNIQESGVKVIDLAKRKGDKSSVSSPTQFLGDGPGDSVVGIIDTPGFGVPSITDIGVGRADPSTGVPSSQFSGSSLPRMNVMQPDLKSAPSSPVISGPDFSLRSGSVDIGPIDNRVLTQAAPGGPSAEAAFASAAAIASSSVPNIGPGRDGGPGAETPDILLGMDLLSTAVVASVAQPVPIVPDIAFGPVQGSAPGPDPLPVPAPSTASASVLDTAPVLVPLPVPSLDPGLASAVTASKANEDKKEKNNNKDGSKLKTALQDLIKALQNIKSTKMDLLSFNSDPLTSAAEEHSVVRTPVLEPMPISAQVLTSAQESVPNQDFDGLCLGSVGTFIDGVGYAKYPEDCEKFLQCYYVGATVRPVIRKCPYGLFWDQTLMLCRRPDDVFCPADPCFTGKKHYRREGGCNSYYLCVNGVSTPKCCGSGFKYDDNNECVSDAVDRDKCDDQCETSDAVIQRLSRSTCNSMEDGSNIYGYINLEHGGLRFRACPFGTTYNPLECRCSARYSSSGSSLTISKTRQRSCRAEFNMNFEDGFIDLSDGNTAFSFMGCYIDRGSVSFSGAGHMTLWGFTGRFYGTTFGIKMRIKPDLGSRQRSETIISNCGFDGEPTINICRENGKVKMTAVVTGSASPMVIEDLCDDDTWCEIVYYFNGKSFVGGVGKNRQSLPCGGILKSNGNPLMIGGCNNGSGFNGLIDDVSIYTMCIPGDF